jgi:hypothetical protein
VELGPAPPLPPLAVLTPPPPVLLVAFVLAPPPAACGSPVSSDASYTEQAAVPRASATTIACFGRANRIATRYQKPGR